MMIPRLRVGLVSRRQFVAGLASVVMAGSRLHSIRSFAGEARVISWPSRSRATAARRRQPQAARGHGRAPASRRAAAGDGWRRSLRPRLEPGGRQAGSQIGRPFRLGPHGRLFARRPRVACFRRQRSANHSLGCRSAASNSTCWQLTRPRSPRFASAMAASCWLRPASKEQCDCTIPTRNSSWPACRRLVRTCGRLLFRTTIRLSPWAVAAAPSDCFPSRGMRSSATFLLTGSAFGPSRFSSDDAYVASSGEDRLIHVAPLVRGDGYSLPPRPAKVLSLAFYGPQQLATAGSDNQIRLWDVAIKEEIGCLRPHRQRRGAGMQRQSARLGRLRHDGSRVGCRRPGRAGGGGSPGRVGSRPAEPRTR